MRKIILIVFFICIFSQGILFAQSAKVVSVEKIEIPDKLRIKDGFIKKRYYGVLRNQKELSKIWSKLYDVYNNLNVLLKTNNEPVPKIDFGKYSVIWYANRGSGASFVESIEVVDESDKVVTEIGLYYSDFGSSHLNLWKIPKTSKDVIFKETKKYETRGH